MRLSASTKRDDPPSNGAVVPELSVIVVSYNTKALTCKALETLTANTDAALEVIVFDNASSDGSATAIERRFPNARLLRSAKNLGFGLANNEAAKVAVGRYLLLLNSDTEVPFGAVDNLLNFARRQPQARIWGGRTLFADGQLNPGSCWGRQTIWSLACQAIGLTSCFRTSSICNPEGLGRWPRDSVREVDIVSGCFLLIERSLWEALGGFAPEYFMYGEDADLCLRARLLGARPLITPTATIIHHGGASDSIKADKLVKLMQAKMQLVRSYFPRWKRPAGVLLLAAWPLSRLVGRYALAWFGHGGSREAGAVWHTVWKRRREWLK